MVDFVRFFVAKIKMRVEPNEMCRNKQMGSQVIKRENEMRLVILLEEKK